MNDVLVLDVITIPFWAFFALAIASQVIALVIAHVVIAKWFPR